MSVFGYNLKLVKEHELIAFSNFFFWSDIVVHMLTPSLETEADGFEAKWVYTGSSGPI